MGLLFVMGGRGIAANLETTATETAVDTEDCPAVG